jgi:hypothetical protein
MSILNRWTIGAAATFGIVAGASTLAVAQFGMRAMTDYWSAPNTLAQLGSNEGVFVDTKSSRSIKEWRRATRRRNS